MEHFCDVNAALGSGADPQTQFYSWENGCPEVSPHREWGCLNHLTIGWLSGSQVSAEQYCLGDSNLKESMLPPKGKPAHCISQSQDKIRQNAVNETVNETAAETVTPWPGLALGRLDQTSLEDYPEPL